MSCVSCSKNSRYVGLSTALVNGLDQSADPQQYQPKHLLRMWSDVLPLEWRVDLHVPRYARYGNEKFHHV